MAAKDLESCANDEMTKPDGLKARCRILIFFLLCTILLVSYSTYVAVMRETSFIGFLNVNLYFLSGMTKPTNILLSIIGFLILLKIRNIGTSLVFASFFIFCVFNSLLNELLNNI